MNIEFESTKFKTTNPIKQKTQEEPSFFYPGSLNLSRKKVLDQCYVDPSVYKFHIRSRMCTYSKEFDLFYIFLPKSGSSTGRKVMKEFFRANEYHRKECNIFLRYNLKHFEGSSSNTLKTASMRDPFSRFFSSYDEMIDREKSNNWKHIPESLSFFKENLGNISYKVYKSQNRPKSVTNLAIKNFEDFVRVYDGKNPFDIHLSLQVPALSLKNGTMINFDYIMDTKEMTNQLKTLAEIVGAPKFILDIESRKRNRMFNISEISKETILKICQLSLIDFCCLNYPLPKECLDENIPVGSRPRCSFKEHKGKNYIQPVIV